MKKTLYILLSTFAISSVLAQDEEEIKSENVRVEFSFNPTLMDAFKIESHPKIHDSIPKETLQYGISPRTIPSEYIPLIRKSKYANLEKEANDLYNSWIYLAAGLYGNAELDVKWNPKFKKSIFKGLSIENYNYQNGIDDERVDNNSMFTDVSLLFGNQLKRFKWDTQLNYQRNAVNWYGLDPGATLAEYQEQKTEQIYNAVNIGANVAFYKHRFLREISPSLSFFSDDYDSSEVYFDLKSILDVELFAKDIVTKTELSFLSGSFDNSLANTGKINYSFFNIIMNPTYQYHSDKFSAQLGFALGVNADMENNNSDVIIYPDIHIHYTLVDNVMTFISGLGGGFTQNTYQTIIRQNPYVSPTLGILGTKKPIEFYAGLQGLLASNIDYTVKATYSVEKDKLLFINNPKLLTITEGYQLGNSFSSAYDDVNTLAISGDLNFKINTNWSANLLGAFNSYKTKDQDKAWNLPSLDFVASTTYKQKKWSSSAWVHLMGNRYDLVNNQEEKLPAFIDLNLKGKYHFTDKFSGHVSLYNLLSNQYDRYVNYQVQGLQALIGMTYSF